MTLHMVVGPPSAGKSTYVETMAPMSTPRFDFDRVVDTVGGGDISQDTPQPVAEVVLAMRRGLLGWLFDPETVQDGDLWVINTNPSDNTVSKWVAAGGVFHVIDPGEDEVVARAVRQGRPDSVVESIRAWYNAPPNIPDDRKVKEARAMKVKDIAVTVKSVTDDSGSTGHLKAYASVFDNVDRHGDVLRKGAFSETIEHWQKSGNTLPLLYGHDFQDPFANIGTVTSVKEDDHGLFIEATIDLDNAKAAQVHRLLKEKRLTQMSYAMDVVDAGEAEVDGQYVYEIRKAHLHEVSVVPIGANSATEVLAVKSGTYVSVEEHEKLIERVKALEDKDTLAAGDDPGQDTPDPEDTATKADTPKNSVDALILSVDILAMEAM